MREERRCSSLEVRGVVGLKHFLVGFGLGLGAWLMSAGYRVEPFGSLITDGEHDDR